jgi:hypothetical protein
MNAEQKRAWLGVVTMTACVVGFFALLPFFGPWVATAAFSIYGLNGFGPLIGSKEQPDERDVSIARRATIAGAMMSYLTFIFGCMGTWIVTYMMRHEAQITAHALPLIAMGGAIVFFAVRSVAILVLYGRPAEADNG